MAWACQVCFPASSLLLAELQRWLTTYGLAPGGGPLLVACSGGLDSVALAHGTVELFGAKKVVLAHVDHGVRPESATDAAFVRTVADDLGVPALVTRLESGTSDEASLRRGRYRALFQALRQISGICVLTAHTEDDQAETVLINLVRSGRLRGFAGIPRRRGVVVRPLLSVPRREVRAYVVRRGLTWREDLSNREPRYLRNRIRKELLPLLESRYRSGIRRRLAHLAEEAGARAGVPFSKENQATAREPRRPAPNHAPTHGLPAIATARIPWSGGAIPDGRKVALFDADLVEVPVIRGFRAGDRLQPFGMLGHRKVADVMREAGIPAEARQGRPLVLDGTGEVLWVPGVLRSSHAALSEKTRHVWRFWMVEVDNLYRGTAQVSLEGSAFQHLSTRDRTDLDLEAEFS